MGDWMIIFCFTLSAIQHIRTARRIHKLEKELQHKLEKELQQYQYD